MAYPFSPLVIDPTPPQYDTVRFLLHPEVRRFIACWQMGLGKTPLAILFCETNLQHRYPNQQIIPQCCLIVAAPTIQKNFIEHLKKFGRNEAHIKRWYRFWSYELIASRPKEFMNEARNNIVVCDEVHDIRSVIVFDHTNNNNNEANIHFLGKPVRAGVQAAALLQGIEHAYKVLGMTGTLIYNSLSDLYNIGWFLLSSPSASNEEKQQYLQHVKLAELRDNKCNENALALFQHVFQGKLSVCSIESCHLTHLFPKVHEINVLIEMNSEYYEAYRLIETDQIEKLREKNENKLTGSGAFWSNLRQGANKINSVQSQKVVFIVEIVKRARERKEKIAITSAFLSRGLGLLIREFTRLKWSFVEVSGDIHSSVERQKSIDKFNDFTSKIDIIILSGAGTTGVNLPSARRQINMESAWNTATRQQTNARIARLGSKMKQVTIYNLMMIKPGNAFASFAEQMRDIIRQQEPGAPSDMVCIAAETVNLHERGEEKEVIDTDTKLHLSIDAHLFLKQLVKSKAFQPFLETYLPMWSLETKPTWKMILAQCADIRQFIISPKQRQEATKRPKNQKKQNKEEEEDDGKTKGVHKNIKNETKQEKQQRLLSLTWQKEFRKQSTRKPKAVKSKPAVGKPPKSSLQFDTQQWLQDLGI